MTQGVLFRFTTVLYNNACFSKFKVTSDHESLEPSALEFPSSNWLPSQNKLSTTFHFVFRSALGQSLAISNNINPKFNSSYKQAVLILGQDVGHHILQVDMSLWCKIYSFEKPWTSRPLGCSLSLSAAKTSQYQPSEFKPTCAISQ